MKIRAIDTLEFGINIQDYDEIFEEFMIELSTLKNEVQQNGKKEIININECDFEVSAKGFNYYKYKIQNSQLIMGFTSKSIKNTPDIFVKFLSTFLWEYGYENAFNVFMKWFEDFNVIIKEIKISRLDICFDTDEITFSERDIKKFFSRSKNKEIRYEPDTVNYECKAFSGFVFGKGHSLLCRIYNKTREIKKSNKLWFEDIWREMCWNEQKEVWRIEFQIRRSVLKELKINTIEDIKKLLDETWAYLTQKWLVMKIKGKDSNSSRWKIDNRWKKIQKAENDHIGIPAIREKVIEGDMKKMLDQASGLVISIVAQKGGYDIDVGIERIKQYIQEKEEDGKINVKNDIEKRRNKYMKNKS